MTTIVADPNASPGGTVTTCPLALQLLRAEQQRRQARVEELERLISMIAPPVEQADERLRAARIELAAVEREIHLMVQA